MNTNLAESMEKTAFWGKILGYLGIVAGVISAFIGLFKFIIGAIPGLIEIVLGYYMLQLAKEAEQFEWENMEYHTQGVMYYLVLYLRLSGVLAIISIAFIIVTIFFVGVSGLSYLRYSGF